MDDSQKSKAELIAEVQELRGRLAQPLDTLAPERLRAHHARVIVDEMYQFVALLDCDGNLLEANQTALRGAGITHVDVAGKPFWEARWWAVSGDIQERLRSAIRETAAGTFVRYEVPIYGADDGSDEIIIDFSLNPVRDARGQVTYLLAEGRNITEKKRAEAEVARKNEELRVVYERIKQLDELKTQFFANVSHELRTPLALILGPVRQVLRDALLTPGQRQDLQVVERNASTLLKHVNDLLDIAKLEANRMDVHYAAVDLAQLVQLTAAHFDGLAQERGISFEVITPPTLLAEVDADKLQRVLLNLLSNAFKFTPDGGMIACRLEGADGRATLVVADTGPGIRPELRDEIFERFRQGDGGTTRRFGGTGLGLAIVKDFVTLHGGTITVGDAPGPSGGSQFQVVIPTAAPTGAKVSRLGQTALEPGDAARQVVGELVRPQLDIAHAPAGLGLPLVLVVEDNLEMRHFLTQTLASDYRVATAADGEAGLREALALKPDLILSDVMMPRMSGEELALAVRGHAELASVPIVLLTAKADDELRVRMLRAGVQDYLVKPFVADEVRARLGNLIAMKRARDVLQRELASQSADLAVLSNELVTRARSLQAQHNLLSSLIEGITDAAFVKDLQGRYVLINQAGARLLGVPVSEVLGRDDTELFTPETARAIMDADRRVLQQGQTESYEEQGTAAGVTRIYLSTKGVYRDGDGNVLGLIGISRDITARKRAEEGLRFLGRASRELGRSLDYEATLTTLARQAVAYLADWCAVDLDIGDGTTRRLAVATGERASAVLAGHAEEYRRSCEDSGDLARVLETGEPAIFETLPEAGRVNAADDADEPVLPNHGLCSGMLVPLVVNDRPIAALTLIRAAEAPAYDQDDLALAQDLARRAALAAENARLYGEAQEAIQVRETFLSIAAHELKTPLTSLLGYGHVLQRRAERGQTGTERDKQLLQALVEQGQRLGKLIDALLDLSRLEQGRLTVERQPVALNELVSRVGAEVGATLERHHLTVSIPDEPQVIYADELRLEQVLSNLLHNAIKYSPEGGPISLELRGDAEVVTLEVRDAGIGIPAEEQDHLFRRFYRAANVDPMKISGLGIGLSIVQEIVARHDGQVMVSSTVGSGSTFVVTLPRHPREVAVE